MSCKIIPMAAYVAGAPLLWAVAHLVSALSVDCDELRKRGIHARAKHLRQLARTDENATWNFIKSFRKNVLQVLPDGRPRERLTTAYFNALQRFQVREVEE